MLKECLEAFEHITKIEKTKGNNILIDNLVLEEGTYLLIDEEFNIKTCEIEKVKNKEEISRTKDYEMFVELDYNSTLINMNKPIDKKKQIHSNNYFTFFIKKASIKEKKLTPVIIKEYYEVLLNPEIKYKSDKKSLKLYKDYEKEAGQVDKEKLGNYKNYILENIFKNEEWIKGKGYLKIFFKAGIADYERESNRYIIPNIFNSNFYNEEINGENFGLHGYNMGMNDKKPFLKHMTRKNLVPEIISIKEALKYKDLFQYLYSLASSGKRDIYINNTSIQWENNVEEDFEGIYLRIKKGKELEILYCDKIIKYRNKIDSFRLENYLSDDDEKVLEQIRITSLNDIENLINIYFFNKQLKENYFTETSGIRIINDKLKQTLITYRMFFFRWFKLGYEKGIADKFKNICIYLIKDTLINNHFFRASIQLNIMIAVLNYLEKGVKGMGDFLKPLHDKLSLKANSSNIEIIESDKEYYFVVGQIVYYLSSLSKSSNRDNIYLKKILNSNNNKSITNIITQMIKKNSHSDNINKKRFEFLASMALGYEPNSKEKDDSMILLGYLSSNIIYEKGETKK